MTRRIPDLRLTDDVGLSTAGLSNVSPMDERSQRAPRIRVLNNFRVKTPPFAERVTCLSDVLPTVLGRFIGHDRPLLEGLAAFSVSGRFDATVTVGVGTAFAFGFANRFFRRRRRQVAKELYFDETSLSSPLKRWLMRWALRDVDAVITNSRGEIPNLAELLHVSPERFEFIPWPAELAVSPQPRPRGDHVFAGGRSFRDWPTLFAAVAGTGLRTVVVAPARGVDRDLLPREVDLSVDIPYDQYLKRLQAARIAVVPLIRTFRSVGQIALLEAMALGIPVIAARVLGIDDYLEHGVSGLLYEPGDVTGLRDTLTRLYADEALQQSLAREAQQRVQEEFNSIAYSRSMLHVVSRVCGVQS